MRRRHSLHLPPIGELRVGWSQSAFAGFEAIVNRPVSEAAVESLKRLPQASGGRNRFLQATWPGEPWR